MPPHVTSYSILAVVVLNAGFAATVLGGTEKRRVDITDAQGGTCDHDVTQFDVTLKKHRNDKLEWTITNACKVDQAVLLCVYLDGNIKNPFKPCQSHPNANVGTPFTVGGNGEVRVVTCHPDPHATEAHYKKQVLVGDEVPSTGCPQHPIAAATSAHHPQHRKAATPKSDVTTTLFTHILDISIEQ